jgi:hypothetical protein
LRQLDAVVNRGSVPPMNKTLLIALIACMSFAPSSWAVLAKLVRQEIRTTTNGEKVLVCIYAVADREIERVYPTGNFCPQYAEV